MSNAVVKSLQPALAERVQELLQRVSYRRADTDEDREAIYRLRYRAYLDEGAIKPEFSRRLTDRFDNSDNGWVIGVHVDGRLVSSMRIHVANQDYPDFVATDVFPDEVKPMIDAGKTVVDPTRFVADPGPGGAIPELAYLTVRIGHMAAEHFQADIVLATVRAEHQAFYRRVFGHTVVCPPRPYLTLLKPLSLMMLDYPAQRERILRRYPFFASTLAERAALFGYPSGFQQQIGHVRPVAANDQPALAG